MFKRIDKSAKRNKMNFLEEFYYWHMYFVRRCHSLLEVDLLAATTHKQMNVLINMKTMSLKIFVQVSKVWNESDCLFSVAYFIRTFQVGVTYALRG